MSQKIEKEKFILALSNKNEEVEEGLGSNTSYKVLYRLYKKYGNIRELQIRGRFEDMEFEEVASDIEFNIELKQDLWNFGVSFTEDTTTGINTGDKSRLLLVLSDWTSREDLTNLIMEKRNSGEFSMVPTDLFVESIQSNATYDSIREILNNSNLSQMNLWFTRRNYNYYASQSEKDTAYSLRFEESEVKDITSLLQSQLDVYPLPEDIVDTLVDLGYWLYGKGIKCVSFDDSFPNLKYLSESQYHNMCAAFLVYLAETYNMSINTTSDNAFTVQYSNYRNAEYCLAEDLLLNLRDRIRPIMLLNIKGSNNFVYVRNVKFDYTYFYFREDELKRLITGDESVIIHAWTPTNVQGFNNNSTRSSDRGSLKSDSIFDSDYLDFYESDKETIDGSPEIISLYDYVQSEEELLEIVNVINNYNARRHNAVVKKYVTIRDLLIRKDPVEGIYQIGYIYSNGADSYNNRLKEDIIISNIQPNANPIVKSYYYPLTRKLSSSLYQLNYIYDFASSAPKGFNSKCDETASYTTAITEPQGLDENEEVIRNYDMAEKFLYYSISRYLSPAKILELEKNLAGRKMEYKASLYKGVYTIASLLPEFVKYFSINDMLKAKLFDEYGNINPEYIEDRGKGSYFSVKNKLFGVMETKD